MLGELAIRRSEWTKWIRITALGDPVRPAAVVA